MLISTNASEGMHNMKTERELSKYIKAQCAAKGVGCFKLHCEGQTGWPDLFLLHGGVVVLMELKSPTGRGVLSARQLLMIKKLNGLGQEVHIVHTKEYADTVIAGLIKRRTAS